MSVLVYTILSLCVLGVVLAVVLYFVAQKFRVEEDPRIDEVEALLPGANCGACGFPGCRGMADALVARDDISELYCPVGGAGTMKEVGGFLGKTAPEREPEVAVVRCAGSCALRPDGTAIRRRMSTFDGARSCAVEAATYAGETGCGFGCLGLGDCVAACAFGAIRMNKATGLPEVDDEKCTACAKCVVACPKLIIELRRKGPKSRRVFVSCVNKEKGGVARKSCEAACIGCSKCVKVCPFEAITVTSNLAYIDPAKCRLCRKCAPECPTGAIVEVGFPARKPAAEAPAAVATPVAVAAE